MPWKDDEARLLIELYDGKPLKLAAAELGIDSNRLQYLDKKWQRDYWMTSSGLITQKAPTRERLVGTLPEEEFTIPQPVVHEGEEPFPLPQE